MKERHLALIVEDDGELAGELAEIVKSLEADSRIVDNKRDAVAALRNNQFCFILLDLQIKGEPDSIKGHIEHGNSLLREIRQMHADHTGHCHWLPVLIVSGFVREVPAAVDVMKDGADDVIQKPFNGRDVSSKIRLALERSGRATHDLCGEGPVPRAPSAGTSVLLVIPGDRKGRRTRVVVGGTNAWLPDRSLKVLLHLMVAHEKGEGVHKRNLGATGDQGFKGISELRQLLKPALGENVDIIDNDQHGNYCLTEIVNIGDCDSERLAKLRDATITRLARDLAERLDARRAKPEGNS